MIRPSDDPRWEEINPVWKCLAGDREYELLGTIQIIRKPRLPNPPEWVVKAAVRPVGEVRTTFLEEAYPSPNDAAEAKRNIENYAGRIHWGYNLVNVGPYYE